MVISGTRLRTDGIKAISRGISGCNQNIKFANVRNRGQLCLFFRNEDLIEKRKCQEYVKSNRGVKMAQTNN